MSDLEKIGRDFKKARKQTGLTQEEVAQKVGMNANYYSRIERGEEKPGRETLLAIAKVLRLKLVLVRS